MEKTTVRNVGSNIAKGGSILVFVMFMSCTYAFADTANVAVAANFLGTMKKISTAFEKQTGHKVIISTGSTGALYSQIINGAPFDIFFSADARRPEKLEADGISVGDSRFTYALGGIAVYSSIPGYVGQRGDILRKGDYKRLAIANPKTAPYGRAAIEVIENMGLQKKVAGKLALGGSVAQAYQFTASGAAQLGFVALSQIRDAGANFTGSYWVVDESLYTPVQQEAVLLIRGKNNNAAKALMNFAKGSVAVKIIHNSGYGTPIR